MNNKLIKEYTEFRKNSQFKVKEPTYKNGQIWLDDFLVEDENHKKYSGNKDVINISYGFADSLAKSLSNLFRYKFVFRKKKVSSIEGVLQGIKHKSAKNQNLVFGYYGLDAYHTRATNFFDDWRRDGILYWQGKTINRQAEEYQLFLDELYISAIQNPLFLNAIKATGEKYLMHHIGVTDNTQTVLTREEYEVRLNTLREFLIFKKII